MISQEFEIKVKVKVNFKGEMTFTDEDYPKKKLKLTEQKFDILFNSAIEALVENWVDDNEIIEAMESDFHFDFSDLDDHKELFDVEFDVSIENTRHITSSESNQVRHNDNICA